MSNEIFLASSQPAFVEMPYVAETVRPIASASFPSLFSFRTSYGSALIVDRLSDDDREIWTKGLAHLATSHAYYDLTHASLENQFAHYYLVLKDGSQGTRAVQPFLVVKQDLMGGMPPMVQEIMTMIRRRFPDFLKLPMIMVGCSAGEGQIVRDIQTENENWVAHVLPETLEIASRKLHSWMIVFKDFPTLYRPLLEPMTDFGYTRIPSMPGAKLALDFTDFEDYLKTKLSHKTRKNIRKKLRDATSGAPITMEVLTDITPIIDELYPLYQQVFQRSKYRFEELTPQYFCEQGQRLPDRSLFFVWRQNGKAVAFCSCLGHDGVLRDNYIGMDYSVALDFHLYFLTFHDTIVWAKAHGYHTYYSAPLNYDPKYHLRMDLSPLDLYVRFRSKWLNPLLRRILPLMEPTRYDPAIPKFANANELW